MNPIETLKYHNKWRRNGEGEMCNPAELGVAIDTVIANYEVMQKQNDELRAKLSNIAASKSCVTCNNTGSYDYDDGFGGVCSSPCYCTNNPYSTYSIINSTQMQSLADIRAEAVIDMAEKEMSAGRMHDGTKRSFVFASDIYDHANRIKEG